MDMEKIPTINPKEARREELYEGMEKKKESVGKLIELFLSNEFQGRELTDKAEEIFLEMKDGMPEGAIERFELLKQAHEEQVKILEKEKYFITKGYNKLTADELESWDENEEETEKNGK